MNRVACGIVALVSLSAAASADDVGITSYLVDGVCESEVFALRDGDPFAASAVAPISGNDCDGYGATAQARRWVTVDDRVVAGAISRVDLQSPHYATFDASVSTLATSTGVLKQMDARARVRATTRIMHSGAPIGFSFSVRSQAFGGAEAAIRMTGPAGTIFSWGSTGNDDQTVTGRLTEGLYTLEIELDSRTRLPSDGLADADAIINATLSLDGAGPRCPSDFNRDGFIDFFDFSDFLSCFEGSDCIVPCPGEVDTNDDGFIDFFDLDGFVAGFELGC